MCSCVAILKINLCPTHAFPFYRSYVFAFKWIWTPQSMVKHSKRYKQIKINFLTQNRRTSLDLPLSGCTLAAIFPPDCAQYHPTQPNQVQLFSECPSVLFWPLRTVNRMWGQGILTPFLMGPGWWGVQNFLKLAGVPPVMPGMLQRKKGSNYLIPFIWVRPNFSPGCFFSPGSDQRVEVGVNVLQVAHCVVQLHSFLFCSYFLLLKNLILETNS